ncbi:hypothetical protein VNO77_05710 [Canavalia gladiata]|uniref:Uncharacterized protein n=1 Tax=Canavalia gladiata TaxID=3824 RepID=A0AAN9N4J6_CANGL
MPLPLSLAFGFLLTFQVVELQQLRCSQLTWGLVSFTLFNTSPSQASTCSWGVSPVPLPYTHTYTLSSYFLISFSLLHSFYITPSLLLSSTSSSPKTTKIEDMEGIKGGGGRVGVGVGVGEDHDMGDGMQCSDHPLRNNPGGICAFCLQEKLGKLVSSSFPLPIRASSSSSSSPSFRSDIAPSSSSTTRPCASITASATATSSSSLPLTKPTHDANYPEYYTRRSRLSFLSPNKKKKKKPSATNSSSASDIVLKRSKSTATPGRPHSLVDNDEDDMVIQDFSPRKRNGFWSFLYLSSKSSNKLNSKSFRDPRISTINSAAVTASAKLKDRCCSGSSLGRNTDIVLEQDNNNNNNHNNSTTTASASASASASTSSLDRKVSRSRSVGCGSRSFSGDFFERISTGFGDCTLRRVESQREGKPKAAAASAAAINRAGDHHCMKERVRCGGLFGGFMMTSSSSSSSSSSYWVSSSADDGKSATVALSHGRVKSWGWAFASPMRAFTTKPSSKENNNRRDIIRDANDKNATPNLSAIPSLLAVRG